MIVQEIQNDHYFMGNQGPYFEEIWEFCPSRASSFFYDYKDFFNATLLINHGKSRTFFKSNIPRTILEIVPHLT